MAVVARHPVQRLPGFWTGDRPGCFRDMKGPDLLELPLSDGGAGPFPDKNK